MMFERADDTNLLISFLQKITDTERLITYEELSKELHRPITGQTSNLHSARRILARDYSQVWLCVRGQGIRLAKDDEIAGHHRRRSTKSIRNRAKRVVIDCRAAKFEKLDESKKLENIGTQCWGNAIISMSKERTLKRVDSIANGASQLPLNKFLEAIKEK